MSERLSVASVTVSFNGAAVLPRQLRALRKQTRLLNEIVVVDNASSDHSANLLETDFPEVTILNQPRNVGVGGGFSAGLDYAANLKKHDWIWLLDQDSVPANDTLEQLLKPLDYLGHERDGIGILAPICINEPSKRNYPGSIWRHGLRKPGVSLGAPISYVDSVISSGSLVRREAVENAGLPRADFFMDFVDHEYCLRLRRHGYRIAVVRASRVEHAIGDLRPVRVFGLEKAWSSHAPWREYYMARNEVFTIWQYDSDWRARFVTVHRLLRHATAILLFGEKKLACIGMMCRGFADGRAGKLGIRSFDLESSSNAT